MPGLFGSTLEPAIRPLGYRLENRHCAYHFFCGPRGICGHHFYHLQRGAGRGHAAPCSRSWPPRKTRTGSRSSRRPARFRLLVFYVFAMQCMSTLAVVYRETKSWKWPLLQLVYMTGLAYVSSLLVYQLFK